MIIEMKKSFSEKKWKAILDKLHQEQLKKKTDLRKVFGILKDKTNGLTYQREIMNGWD